MTSWVKVPLKRVATLNVSNVDKKSSDDGLPVRLCNYTDVYYRGAIRADQDFMVATATSEQVTRFRLLPGDVIITKDSETADDIGVPAFVESSAPDLVCGYHLALIRPTADGVDGRFLFWAMTSQSMRDQLSVTATGVTRFGLRSESIGSALVPLPPLPTQRAIADYLDAETARIDALIEKKRRMVEVLQERLRLMAHQLTTSEGNQMALRHAVSQVKTGTTPDSDELMMDDDGPVPWYSPGDVGEWLSLAPPARTLATAAISGRQVPVFPPRSVLVVGIGATAGRVAHLDREGSGNQQMTCITPGPFLDSRFLAWQLFARSDEIRSTAPFTTLPILNNDFLKSIVLKVPELARQTMITSQLDDDARRTRSLVNFIESQVSKLVEHRQALITAAVTGELSIPGVAA